MLSGVLLGFKQQLWVVRSCLFVTWSALQKGVDYLPMAKPVMQLTTRGYAVTVRLLTGVMPVAGSPL